MKKRLIFLLFGLIAALGLVFYWRFFKKEPKDILLETPPLVLNKTTAPRALISATPSVSPAKTAPTSAPFEKIILLSVPFAAQAPFGEWADPVFQDACEEAAVLMAVSWLDGKKSLAKNEAKAGILAITDFEDKKYGAAPDRSAQDTARLIRDYASHQRVWVRYDVTASGIISELKKGNLVITPVNGQILKNPYYTAPGPLHHMLVIIGFDASKNEFITNDAGTRQGENYRYGAKRIENSLADYPTGSHLEAQSKISAAIIIEPRPRD